LGNKLSLEEDSFSKKFERKKEYPVYTRPKIFKNLICFGDARVKF